MKNKKNDIEIKFSGLINFDKKTKIFVYGLLIMYVCLSMLKVHTSSLPIWDSVFGNPKPRGLILGQPRGIRQDEWMIMAPAVLSQSNTNFNITNSAFGAGNSPAFLGLPVKHITSILKPSFWPYFVFDVERAFAFSWNMAIFFSIISTFLLFMLLTKSDFYVSSGAALFIFLSSAVQWWSYGIISNMSTLNFIVLAFIYILYSKDLKLILFSSILLLLYAFVFLTSLYPPWQIPLLYLYTLLLIGFLVKNWNIEIFKQLLPIKLISFGFVGLLLGIFVYLHLDLTLETMQIMADTVYPGKRTTNGGDLLPGKLFSEFFGMFFTETKFPAKWLNICEASSVVMFFPILFYTIGRNYLLTKKIDITYLLLVIYITVLLIWILVGFPTFLSKITLFSMSPVYRTLPILGIVNVFLLFLCLADKNLYSKKSNIVETIITFVAFFIFIFIINSITNNKSGKFYTSSQIIGSVLIFGTIYFLIWYQTSEKIKLTLLVLLVLVNIRSLATNPISMGMESIIKNQIVLDTKEIATKDPEARWAVFGNQMLCNLLKVNGIKCINGVKHVPILSDMKVLDPSGKDNFVYNRYAHINMGSFITGTDSLVFKLNENEVVNDNYSLYMDPCSPKLKKLGVKYVAFTYQPQASEIRCMTLVINSGLLVYKYND